LRAIQIAAEYGVRPVSKLYGLTLSTGGACAHPKPTSANSDAPHAKDLSIRAPSRNYHSLSQHHRI
jgi:hypothetical protein